MKKYIAIFSVLTLMLALCCDASAGSGIGYGQRSMPRYGGQTDPRCHG